MDAGGEHAIELKVPVDPPAMLVDHQDSAKAVCGVIPQFLGYNDDLNWTYQVLHYAPVVDAFAIGGTA